MICFPSPPYFLDGFSFLCFRFFVYRFFPVFLILAELLTIAACGTRCRYPPNAFSQENLPFSSLPSSSLSPPLTQPVSRFSGRSALLYCPPFLNSDSVCPFLCFAPTALGPLIVLTQFLLVSFFFFLLK